MKASVSIDKVVVSESEKLERTFDGEYNDDCVSVFRKSVDDDHDQSAANTKKVSDLILFLMNY